MKSVTKFMQRMYDSGDGERWEGRVGARAAGNAREGGPCIRTLTVPLCVYLHKYLNMASSVICTLGSVSCQPREREVIAADSPYT